MQRARQGQRAARVGGGGELGAPTAPFCGRSTRGLDPWSASTAPLRNPACQPTPRDVYDSHGTPCGGSAVSSCTLTGHGVESCGPELPIDIVRLKTPLHEFRRTKGVPLYVYLFPGSGRAVTPSSYKTQGGHPPKTTTSTQCQHPQKGSRAPSPP